MTKLFGTDGIRGVVGQWPLVPEFFLELGIHTGRLFKSELNNGVVIIGRDTRASSPMLQSAFTSGLLFSGMDVIDSGVIPTSAVAWIVKNQKFDAGAVISASHNPIEQNGIKFFNSNGYKLPEEDEEKIEQWIDSNAKNSFIKDTKNNKFGRSIEGIGLSEPYINSLISEHPPKFLSGIKILIDCANGSASILAPLIFSQAGAQVTTVNASPTGQNINVKCGSEYVRRYPQVLADWIINSNSDFGIAFDGDADRVIFVDDKGKIIDGDHILGMLALYFNNGNRLLSNSVVTTSMRNSGLKHFLELKSIKLLETPVGDKFVVEKLREIIRNKSQMERIGLGGEQSGHVVILNEGFTTGDGIRTALFTMRALLESGLSSISEFARMIGKTPQIIASAYIGSGSRFSRNELDEMEKKLKNSNSLITRVNYRYSGTEPIFRVMLEADNNYKEIDLASIALRICHNAQSISGTLGEQLEILDCSNGGYITL